METVNGRGPAIEVVARPERRRFTREYEQRVLAETDACPAGKIEVVLRRAGLLDSIRRESALPPSLESR